MHVSRKHYLRPGFLPSHQRKPILPQGLKKSTSEPDFALRLQRVAALLPKLPGLSPSDWRTLIDTLGFIDVPAGGGWASILGKIQRQNQLSYNLVNQALSDAELAGSLIDKVQVKLLDLLGRDTWNEDEGTEISNLVYVLERAIVAVKNRCLAKTQDDIDHNLFFALPIEDLMMQQRSMVKAYERFIACADDVAIPSPETIESLKWLADTLFWLLAKKILRSAATVDVPSLLLLEISFRKLAPYFTVKSPSVGGEETLQPTYNLMLVLDRPDGIAEHYERYAPDGIFFAQAVEQLISRSETLIKAGLTKENADIEMHAVQGFLLRIAEGWMIAQKIQTFKTLAEENPVFISPALISRQKAIEATLQDVQSQDPDADSPLSASLSLARKALWTMVCISPEDLQNVWRPETILAERDPNRLLQMLHVREDASLQPAEEIAFVEFFCGQVVPDWQRFVSELEAKARQNLRVAGKSETLLPLFTDFYPYGLLQRFARAVRTDQVKGHVADGDGFFDFFFGAGGARFLKAAKRKPTEYLRQFFYVEDWFRGQAQGFKARLFAYISQKVIGDPGSLSKDRFFFSAYAPMVLSAYTPGENLWTDERRLALIGDQAAQKALGDILVSAPGRQKRHALSVWTENAVCTDGALNFKEALARLLQI